MALGQAGASVILIVRRDGPIQDIVGNMRSLGIQAAGYPIDVRQAGAVSETVLSKHGVPDILVNAAGINPRSPLETLTQEQ